MASVYVGIGHTYYLVIAELRLVKLCVKSRTERRYHRLYLVIGEHLVLSGLLDVEYLAPERKYRLELPVSAHFCTAACGVSLDYEYLTERCVLFLTVCELSGQ